MKRGRDSASMYLLPIYVDLLNLEVNANGRWLVRRKLGEQQGTSVCDGRLVSTLEARFVDMCTEWV